MDFQFTPDEEAFRQEVSQWLDQELTPDILKEMEGFTWIRLPKEQPPGPLVRDFSKKLGAKGWVGMTWPRKYGGQERSSIDQYIVFEELEYHRARLLNAEAITIMGPIILAHGSEELKSELLPRIAHCEIEMALGYTESEAGSDLAALQIQAVENGDDYVIKGEKCFSSAAHYADYHWLAARTEATVPKHRGISLFIVDLKSPGIIITPMWTMSGSRTNQVFYDEVRIHKRNMVGEKNKGWEYLVEALDKERIFLSRVGEIRRAFEDLVEYAEQTRCDGELISKDPLVGSALAEMAIELEIAKLLVYRALWMENQGIKITYEAAMVKLFTSELTQRLVNMGTIMLGPHGQLQKGSKWAPLSGLIEEGYRAAVMHTFGGGSSEIMRNIIAIRGLRLPRK